MTWAKYGNEFVDDCANAGLSDHAVRTHFEAIHWLYRVERYDMRVPKQLVRRFAGSPLYEAAIQELLDRSFWRDDDDTYLVMHHRDVVRQSLVAQQKKRTRDRQAQTRARAKLSADISDDVSADVSADTVSQSVKHSGLGAEGGYQPAIWPDPAPIPNDLP